VKRVAELIASLQGVAESAGVIARISTFLSTIRRLLLYYTRLDKWISPEYRFWIDPLLCPLAKARHEGLGEEEKQKEIEEMQAVHDTSLARMKDVYTKATHVLVLDASLSVRPAQEADPIEVLLRIFGSSPWMRRLWTLQGGQSTPRP
jgi:hypothetical protein